MFDFAIKGFRGFHNEGFIPVRPLTILVGENSTGKTSFLAALKYIFNFCEMGSEASFNADPFHLGTFGQIAHTRDKDSGPCDRFSFRMRQTVSPRRLDKDGHKKTKYNTHFSISFSEEDSDPVVSSLSVSYEKGQLDVNIREDQLAITLTPFDAPSVNIPMDRGVPPFIQMDLIRHWPFLMRELLYIASRERAGLGTKKMDKNIRDQFRFIVNLAEATSMHIAQNVFATSAIRTKPRRTYDPTGSKIDSEGSHVPFEIAKLYRSKDERAWQSLKDSIDSFGRSSGMFSEINVKSYGETKDDPFQINFSLQGPELNLVDIGYGTSQILPIIFMISHQSHNEMFLIQQPEVHLHPRAQASLGELFVDTYKTNNKKFVIETHSDFIIDRVRLAIKKKKINPKDVSLLFFERDGVDNHIFHVELDKSGDPVSAPEGYRNFFIDEQMKLLGLS